MKQRTLLEAILFFVTETREFSISNDELGALEAQAQDLWHQETGQAWSLEPERMLALRCGGLLSNIHQLEQETLQAHAGDPGEGMAQLDEGLQDLRSKLTSVLKSLEG